MPGEIFENNIIGAVRQVWFGYSNLFSLYDKKQKQNYLVHVSRNGAVN